LIRLRPTNSTRSFNLSLFKLIRVGHTNSTRSFKLSLFKLIRVRRINSTCSFNLSLFKLIRVRRTNSTHSFNLSLLPFLLKPNPSLNRSPKFSRKFSRNRSLINRWSHNHSQLSNTSQRCSPNQFLSSSLNLSLRHKSKQSLLSLFPDPILILMTAPIRMQIRTFRLGLTIMLEEGLIQQDQYISYRSRGSRKTVPLFPWRTSNLSKFRLVSISLTNNPKRKLRLQILHIKPSLKRSHSLHRISLIKLDQHLMSTMPSEVPL
jgi:hypothetical protein